jgi:hypothetical protein
MGSERWLNLELRDSTGAPLAGRPYELTLADGSRREGTLDHEGCLSELLPSGCDRVTLLVAQRRIELDLIGLPPCDSIVGAQERLNHLHYSVGEPDGVLGPLTIAALSRFQRDHGLVETGVLDPATIDRLREEHGA